MRIAHVLADRWHAWTSTDATRQQKQVLPSAQSSATPAVPAPSIVTQDSQLDDKYEAEQFIIFKPLDRAVSWAEVCAC
jgi:hypothetical protein